MEVRPHSLVSLVSRLGKLPQLTLTPQSWTKVLWRNGDKMSHIPVDLEAI